MIDFDLAIGVHALVYGLILVTADRAFERLRLTRENWMHTGPVGQKRYGAGPSPGR